MQSHQPMNSKSNVHSDVARVGFSDLERRRGSKAAYTMQHRAVIVHMQVGGKCLKIVNVTVVVV